VRNASLRFVCRDVPLTVERDDLPFTSRCAAGQRLVIPVKHGDGRYLAPPELDPRQVVLRYAENPNGSTDDVAGVCNEAGNVLGLMPHPEHAVDPLLGSDDGALLLASLVDAARERALAAVA
jgi:phosphoribosylformylglycinamidine synthase